MKKILEFKDGIIGGNKVRNVINVFPEIKGEFKQRKTYDEYYFSNNELLIDITIENIDDLTKSGLTLEIDWNYIKIL